MISFEKFLEDVCFRINPQVLDDDMSDFFDKWISDLDGEGYLKWGQLYGEQVFLEGARSALESLKIDLSEGKA